MSKAKCLVIPIVLMLSFSGIYLLNEQTDESAADSVEYPKELSGVINAGTTSNGSVTVKSSNDTVITLFSFNFINDNSQGFNRPTLYINNDMGNRITGLSDFSLSWHWDGRSDLSHVVITAPTTPVSRTYTATISNTSGLSDGVKSVSDTISSTLNAAFENTITNVDHPFITITTTSKTITDWDCSMRYFDVTFTTAPTGYGTIEYFSANQSSTTITNPFDTHTFRIPYLSEIWVDYIEGDGSTVGNTLTVHISTSDLHVLLDFECHTEPDSAQYDYSFDGWTTTLVDGNGQPLDLSVASSSPHDTVLSGGTITANFSRVVNTYTISVQSNNTSWGTVNVPTISNVPYGTSITTSTDMLTIGSTTVTATPHSADTYSYYFDYWYNAGGIVTGDRTISAMFGRELIDAIPIYVGQTWTYTPSTSILSATFTISGTATDWLSLSGNTISGTAPTVSQVTYYDLTITATTVNPIQTETQSMNFAVVPYMTASVNPSTLYLKENGSIPNSQSESLTFSYNGFGTGSYIWGILSDNGTGVEISQAGVLYGTAGPVTNGPVTVTARLTGTVDGITQTVDVPFSVEIVADLEFTSPAVSDVQLYVGDNWTYTVTTTLNSANITINGTASSWLTVSNGTISGTAPNDSTVTRYTLDIVAESMQPDQSESMSVNIVVVPYMTASVSPNTLYLWENGPIPASMAESIVFSYTGFGTGTYEWTISNDYGTGVQIRADGTIYGTAGNVTASPVTVTARLTGTVDGITQTEDVTFDVMIVAKLVFTTDPLTDGVIS